VPAASAATERVTLLSAPQAEQNSAPFAQTRQAAFRPALDPLLSGDASTVPQPEASNKRWRAANRHKLMFTPG